MPDTPPTSSGGPTDARGRFQALFDAHYRAVLSYALRRVGQPADAHDVVAEVFTAAWRRIAEVPGAPGDRLWLFGVARNVVAHQRRSTARRGRLRTRLEGTATPPSTPEGPLDPEDGGSVWALRVRSAVDRLPEAQAESIRLVLWDGLSHEEAARVMGCSANAVAIRLHRARRRLRRNLADLDPAPGARGDLGRQGGGPRDPRTQGVVVDLADPADPDDPRSTARPRGPVNSESERSSRERSTRG